MPEQIVAFRERVECAEGVAAFRFTKPEGYGFLPGQYFTLGLDTREGRQSKPFTHSDAPDDPFIELTTRLTGSAFKNALVALSPGEGVAVGGPFGRPALPEGTSRAAFLVGGVGVTPARSVLRDARHRRTGLEAVVFLGNQNESCMPYAAEFEAMHRVDSGIRVVNVLVAPSADWTGERGFISADIVRRYIDPDAGWHFVVAGPPAMVDAMSRLLDELAVPKERTSLERFSGY